MKVGRIAHSLVDVNTIVAGLLVGRKLCDVQKHEYHWSFGFGAKVVISAECPWRILSDEIAFTDRDHGQQFGLLAPLDGEQEVVRLLSGKLVEHASRRERTGDLLVEFSGSVTLEVLNLSRGYEAWQLFSPGMEVIVQGGGQVVICS
jgi:hypothetical protein